jgi:two-component system chemotaxis sensor kinase CheA
MKSKEEELNEIFLYEALEISEQLNRLFTFIEKNHSDLESIEAIFRLTHTLKANASAMGQTGIAEISHGLEDIFSLLKTQSVSLTPQLFDDLFKANDKLNALIGAVKTGEEIAYKGLKTKLAVIARNLAQQQIPSSDPETSGSNTSETTTVLSFSDVVQVPIRKLDNLLNLIGELVIEKDRLAALRPDMLNRLARLSSDLQYGIMDVRLVQVNILFQKFYRIVRDLAAAEGKQVNLQIYGAEIEIDRSVLQSLSDSLIHLVRNSISHGIEKPQERIEKGKKPIGTVTLSALSDKSSVVISVSDDGKGISAPLIRKKAIEKGLISREAAEKISDTDVLEFIFEPGFSSAEVVSDISGRGVGMDVVRKATHSIGGKVKLKTQEGMGTTFELTVPASMAVKNALLFELNGSTFAFGLAYTEAVISIEKSQIHAAGKNLLTYYLDKTITLIFLADFFEGLDSLSSFNKLESTRKIPVIVTSFDGRLVGFGVDRLLQQKEIIEKPLRQPLDQSKYISAAAIMGDGSVCLVVDIAALYNQLFKQFTRNY